MMPEARQGADNTVKRMFDFLAPAYNNSLLQNAFHRSPQHELLSQLRTHGCRRIADVGCGTGSFTDQIARELDPEEIYGVDVSDGMLEQARARSDRVKWMSGPAERVRFDDQVLDAVLSTSAFHFFD
jgi:ubiquinone/menaquinone biosynthesis C-methylase UbiE